MPPGCLRARMPSASSPSSGSGASWYRCSASAALKRPPSRTFSATALVLSILKPQRPVERDQLELARVSVEGLQPVDLAVPENVLDITPQVAPRHRLPRRVVRIVGGGY